MGSPNHPNLDGLIGLARRHGIDVKPTLLRVLTDLYVQKPSHPADEEHEYATLALRLIDSVDEATRAIVARTLAAYPGAPAAVLGRLGGEAGRPGASARTQPDRAQNARPGEPPPAPSLAPAAGAVKPDLAAMFFAADAPGRRLLLANLHDADDVRPPRRLPGDPRRAVAQLEQAALGGRPSEEVRELERALGISRMMAERIVGDPGGEPMVVAAKALDMPLPVLQRILLFVNPAVGHSVERVYSLSALYEEISPEPARHLVSLWRDPPAENRRGRHGPLTFEDEMRRVRDQHAAPPERLASLDEDDDLFLDRA